MKGIHLIVQGRVQGVGFRYYTKKKADVLGILGTVENKYDGSVEIFAFAQGEKLENFIKSVQKGFGSSYVKRLLKKEIELKTHRAFTIL